MKVVDWLEWIRAPEKKPLFCKLTNEDYVWKDTVTGTFFTISKLKYHQLMQELEEQLQQRVTAEEKFQEVWNNSRLPYGSASSWKLGIHLPYPIPLDGDKFLKINFQDHTQLIERTRLNDFIVLRTGLYYALHQPSAEDWQAIRNDLLQIESQYGSEIDEYLKSGTWKIEDRRITVVKAGAVRIKQYLLETNNIQGIRGASLLLDELNNERIQKLMASEWTPESIIYSGGGNILIVLPEDEGAKACRLIEELYSRVTVSAQAVAEFVEVNIALLNKENLANTLAQLELKKTNRQMCKPPLTEEAKREIYDINAYRTHQILTPIQELDSQVQKNYQADGMLYTESLQKLCHLCRQRTAKYQLQYQGSLTITCLTCSFKIFAGRETQSFINELKEITVQRNFSITLSHFPNHFADMLDSYSKTLDHHLSKQWVGVVYGDGNNMGGIVANISSLLEYRYFSNFVDGATRYSLYTGLLDILGEKIEHGGTTTFQIIAAGGDDLLFIVPAPHSLEVAKETGERFDFICKNHSTDESGMTMSIGVAISDYKVPFTRLFSTANELLQSAKQYVKQHALNQGTLDFMVLKSSVPYVDSLSNYRQLFFVQEGELSDGQAYVLEQLIRPLSWNTYVKLNEWVQALDSEPKQKTIVETAQRTMEDQPLVEGLLYFQYYLSKLNVRDRTRFEEMVADFAKNGMEQGEGWKSIQYCYKQSRLNQDGYQELVAPWQDLLDLLEIGGA